MKLGWFGKALLLAALDQVAKALDARRASRLREPSPDSAADVQQTNSNSGERQPADQDHFEAR